MNGRDFIMVMGEPPIPATFPGNIFKTDEANKALRSAYRWASDPKRRASNARANAAAVYIEAIPENRNWEAQTPAGRDRADATQLNYILSNLQYWKGDEARETKAVLKSYYNSINPYK